MKDHLVVDIDVGIYSLDDANRAAYWFSDTCDAKIERLGNNVIRVELWPRSAHKPELLERQFHTALMEERLRRIIELEAGEIRRRLWAAALREFLPPYREP